MIALTGATGQLGHYVLQDLLNTVPASQIVAIVRNPAKAQALSQQAWLSARPTTATKRR
ncbi:NmrA family protein [Klebsiella pneumoniae subsp. ozaenae]|uniref:NmrA family protein n=1 Tax=Klebsiella pneumoniae subsp. ozaenae TaxID=574 RepID=A0A378AZS6_KLEPO|nr:NmrA family protein [Klebsiella pneumoniae subsp. ozaenae]